jgi:hypothetical protein
VKGVRPNLGKNRSPLAWNKSRRKRNMIGDLVETRKITTRKRLNMSLHLRHPHLKEVKVRKLKRMMIEALVTFLK